LVTGIGGTGVITIGEIIAAAAHAEGKAVTVLDMSGLAQKGGTVTSHVRVAETPEQLHAIRIGTGTADLVLGCDLVVAAGRDALSCMNDRTTRVVLNTNEAPTADFVRNPDWRLPGSDLQHDILDAAGKDHVDFVPATDLATALFGDTIATNMFLLGYAWQKGWIPLAQGSLENAIELNGVAVQTNQEAFLWGRRAAHDLERVKAIAFPAEVIALKPAASLNDVIARRADFLVGYQDASYAARYRALVDKVRAAETALRPRDSDPPKLALTEAVARNYFKLLAIKDEYEVARLHARPEFLARIREQFEGDYTLKFHLAPPTLAKPDAAGQVHKREYGAWMLTVFRVLAGLRFLRGSALDPFRRSEDRKLEQRLLAEYERNVEELIACLGVLNLSLAVDIASIPQDIRGYGHIRAKSALVAKQKEEKLLAQWRAPVAPHERAA
jgi:indolepyruvate ferredoxin oxidoreductase